MRRSIPEPTKSKVGHRLLDLPSEMQSRILRNPITQDRIMANVRSHGAADVLLHPIALANKHTRLVYIEVALERTIFEIHSRSGNASSQTWLRSSSLSSVLGEYSTSYDAIKELGSAYFSACSYACHPATAADDDVVLMKCGNLARVTMRPDFLWNGNNLLINTTSPVSMTSVDLCMSLEGPATPRRATVNVGSIVLCRSANPQSGRQDEFPSS